MSVPFVYKPVIKKILIDLERKRQYLPKNLHKLYETIQIIPNERAKQTFSEIKENEYIGASLIVKYSEYVANLYKNLFVIQPELTSVFFDYIYKQVVNTQSIDFESMNSGPNNFELSVSGRDRNGCGENSILIDFEDKIFKIGTPEKEISFSLNEIGQSNVLAAICDYIINLGEECKFFVLDLSFYFNKIDGHQNVIFGELSEENKIILNYYEPYGFVNINVVKILKRIFQYSKNRIFLNYNTSNVVGSQAYTKDEIGYCVMFSLFWIYTVLSIAVYNLKHNSYIPSRYWIDNVENYYITKLKNSKNLYEMIITFAVSIFNDYVASLPEEERKKRLEVMELAMNEHYLSGRKLSRLTPSGTGEKEERKERETYSLRQLKKLAKKDPEYTYESWEKARKREIRRVFENWNKERKHRLGEPCNKHSECISKRCKYEEGVGYCAAPLRAQGNK